MNQQWVPIRPLLEHDALIMRQAKNANMAEFEHDIYATNWTAIGSVVIPDHARRHPVFPPRELGIWDATGHLCTIHDPITTGVDRYDIVAPDGRPLGVVEAGGQMMQATMDLQLPDGARFHFGGALLQQYFQVTLNGVQVAHATRNLPNDPRRLDNEQYYFYFDPKMPQHHRLAILGALVASSRFRGKLSNN